MQLNDLEDLILHVVYDHQQHQPQQPIQPNQQQLEKQQQKLIQAQHQFEIYQQRMEYELQQLQRMEYEQQKLLHTCRLCLKTLTRKDNLQRHSAIHIREMQTR